MISHVYKEKKVAHQRVMIKFSESVFNGLVKNDFYEFLVNHRRRFFVFIPKNSFLNFSK